MGWMELMLVGVVALIVVGPRDLPVMFQSLGKMTAKVRRMAREFSSAMNDAANATGASDIAKDLKGITSPKSLGIDKLKDAANKFEKWEPGKETKVMGSETAKLAAERAETTRKVKEGMDAAARARRDKEQAEAAAESGAETKAVKPAAAKAKPAKAKPPKSKPAKAKPAKAETSKPAATKAKPSKAKATPAKATPAKAKATAPTLQPVASKSPDIDTPDPERNEKA